jgi:hypothetical protein
MPKRFTATEKWDRPWFRGLPAAYKALWAYVCDRCDMAGVWYVDEAAAQFQVDASVTVERALELFERQVVVFDGGKRWFIPEFIKFQYGCEPEELTPDSKIHKGVLRTIASHPGLESLIKGFENPLQRVKDKDKDKEKEKEEDNDLLRSPDDLQALWNETARKELPRCKAVTGPRAKAARERILENPERAYWVEVIQRLNKSPFCLGANDRGWKANMDFLLRPNSATKALEGAYDPKPGQALPASEVERCARKCGLSNNWARRKSLRDGAKICQPCADREAVEDEPAEPTLCDTPFEDAPRGQ